jgi:hypothetical protein
MRGRRAFLVAITLVGLVGLAGTCGFLAGAWARDTENREPALASKIAESGFAKQLVAHKLIEGRVTFSQAVHQFQAFNKALPEAARDKAGAIYAGADEQERVGRQVIAYVSSELEDSPKRARTLVKRLKAELANLSTSSTSAAGN